MALWRFTSCAILLSLLGAPLCAQTLHAHADPATIKPPAVTAAESHAPMSAEGYEHLLNLLFPADHAVRPGLDYTIVLRYEPHMHPESQVVLHRYHNGKVESTFDRVLEGNAWRTAYQSGEDLTNSQFDTVAKTIAVRRSNFSVTDADVQAWHAQLFPLLSQGFSRVRNESKQINRSGTWKAMANGTRYELWLIQGDDEVHLVSWDSEVEPTPSGTTGLILWMNTIRWHAAGHTLAQQVSAGSAVLVTPSATAAAIKGATLAEGFEGSPIQ